MFVTSRYTLWIFQDRQSWAKEILNTREFTNILMNCHNPKSLGIGSISTWPWTDKWLAAKNDYFLQCCLASFVWGMNTLPILLCDVGDLVSQAEVIWCGDNGNVSYRLHGLKATIDSIFHFSGSSSIYGHKLIVCNTDWPSWVFEKKYAAPKNSAN